MSSAPQDTRTPRRPWILDLLSALPRTVPAPQAPPEVFTHPFVGYEKIAARGLVGLGNRLYHGEKSYRIVGNSRRWYTVSAVLVAISVLGLLVVVVVSGALTVAVRRRGLVPATCAGALATASIPATTTAGANPTCCGCAGMLTGWTPRTWARSASFR